MKIPTHRWRRARAGDPEYGRLCACGDLKDEQALRCRHCYAEARRLERPTCACGAPLADLRSTRCKPCSYEAMRGVPVNRAPRAQPQSHPWRRRFVA